MHLLRPRLDLDMSVGLNIYVCKPTQPESLYSGKLES